MGFILFIFFTILLLVIALFLSMVKGVWSLISGKPSSMGNPEGRRYSSWNREQHNSYTSDNQKKIFPKDEGGICLL